MKSAVILGALLLCGAAHAQEAPLLSRAESSHYEETSRYDDVLSFFNELGKQSPLMRMEMFGKTVEGRDMPLIILSDPPISQPREARESGKPIIFVMANIHAGEVEGKEAVQHLSRRILTGDLRPLLDKLIILIAPDYNADGNEPIALTNRTLQNGPIGGVGHRENAQGYDLNRDYIKLDAPETRALVGIFNTWDPHLTVDLHTTDGSFHGYHLTYSIPLNPTVDANILSYSRDKMMPALTKAMAKDGYRSYYYGNFSDYGSNPDRATNAPRRGAASGGGGVFAGPLPPRSTNRTWVAFSQQPRAGQNYLGFRNRLTILSEAYAYLDFHDRIEVTAAFVTEILKYSAAHADEIRKLTERADLDTVQNALKGTLQPIGVEYEYKALPKQVPILMGEVTRVPNPRSGINMAVVVKDKYKSLLTTDYGLFAATRTVPAGRAYIFRHEDGMKAATEKLLAHGITVEELTAPLTTEAEDFVISSVKKGYPPFQSHRLVKLAGEFKKETVTYPEGSIIVRTAQPLGVLAAYLLEPESDDGLVTWNFLDPYLDTGKTYPVSKIMQDVKFSSRVVSQ